MLRRVLIAAVAALLALTASGCAALPIGSGDTAEAAAILEQAQKAAGNLESISFTMTMTGDIAGESFTMKMNGGGYATGEHAGEMAATMSLAGAGLPATDMQMVVLGGDGYLELNGQWQKISNVVPTGSDLNRLQSQIGALDIGQFVKNVHVDRHTTFLGEPVTKIVGSIDAQDFLKAFMGQLGNSFGQAGGGSGTLQIPDDVLKSIGDIRVVVYVSETTHIVRAVHEEFSMTYQGQTASFDVDMSLSDVNKPIEIPKPPIA